MIERILREAALIIPAGENNGVVRADVRREATRRAVALFGGGYTTEAEGYWQDEGVLYEERVWVLRIAMEPTAANIAALVSVADYVMRELDQFGVYLSLPDGRVIIRKVEEVPGRPLIAAE